MGVSEARINELLRGAQARYIDSARKDISAALNAFSDLKPELDPAFVFPDGSRRSAFRLRGTIPVLYRSNTYNIPVSVVLWDTHPYYAPLCYVAPTESMAIKESETVDKSGKIFLPYLQDWRFPGYDLNGLLQVMTLVFQDRCPVFSKAAAGSTVTSSRPAPPPQPAAYPVVNASYAGSHNPPYPTTTGPPYPVGPTNSMPANPPYPTSGGYYNIPQPTPSSSVGTSTGMGTIQPEHVRASLISAVEDRLRAKLRDRIGTAEAQLASVRATADDLRRGGQKLRELVSTLETNDAALAAWIAIYEPKKVELERALAAAGKDASSKEDGDDGKSELDAAIQPTTPVHRQLLDNYAKDLACDDALWALAGELRAGRLPIVSYLRLVRQVARQQFGYRATMRRARERAGLPV